MEEKFIAAWAAAREKAAALGVRIRPVADSEALKTAKRVLAGRRLSDGFNDLRKQGHLELSLSLPVATEIIGVNARSGKFAAQRQLAGQV